MACMSSDWRHWTSVQDKLVYQRSYHWSFFQAFFVVAKHRKVNLSGEQAAACAHSDCVCWQHA
jgi:hypothetical protein